MTTRQRARIFGVIGLSLLAVAQPASTQETNGPSSASGAGAEQIAEVVAGGCNGSGQDEIVAPLAAFREGTGEWVGSAKAQPVAVSVSRSIPLSFDQIQDRPYALVVQPADQQGGGPLACGVVAGALTHRGELIIGLGEENDSGVIGIAYLTENPVRQSQTDITLFVAEIQEAARDGGRQGDQTAAEMVATPEENGAGDAVATPLADALATPIADAVSTDEAAVGAGPLAYWRLDERSGTTAADIADGFAGTYGPGVGLNAPSAVPVSNNAAAFFNGTGDAYVDMGDVLDFGGQEPFSLEAWVTPSNFRAGAYPRIAQKAGTDDEGLRQGYILVANGDTGQVGLERWRDGAKESVFSTGPIPTDSPTHVVATYDGGTMRLFINGVEVVSAPSSLSLPDTAFPFRIGNSTEGTSPLAGIIDEVVVYGGAIDPETVVAHYRAGTDLPQSSEDTSVPTPVS